MLPTKGVGDERLRPPSTRLGGLCALKIIQEESDDRARVGPRLWQRVENGDPITGEALAAVAEQLGVEPTDLLKR